MIGTILLPKYGIEIKIIGTKNLNRSINGDIVAVKLLPENGNNLYYRRLIFLEWIRVKLPEIKDEEEIDVRIETQDTVKLQEEENLKSIIEKIRTMDLTPSGKITR